MIESYESIRDNSDLVPQEVRRRWVEADQSERTLRQTYERIEQDQDLTGEAKARKATEAYEQNRGRVESRKKATRAALLQQARFAEQAATPRPSGEPLSSSDASKLLLDQNEANRIVRVAERRKAAPGPFRHDAGAFLTQEYKRGLEIGGVEGGAICRGTLRAAKELGVSAEDVLHRLRDDRHHQSLDRARRLEYAADMISTTPPKPPKSLMAKAQAGRDINRRPAPFLVPGTDGPPICAAPDGSSRSTSAPKKTRRKRSFS